MSDISSIRLNSRLAKIAELVPKAKTLVDIGTDHAYIPVKLVLEGKVERAIASDIKKGPLLRAKENVIKYGIEKLVDIRLGAGLETVSAGEAEIIVIAGMGGILISNILADSTETVKAAKKLILQPMTAQTELREYLSENGYEIIAEHLVAEENKLYNIIEARLGEGTKYSLRELYLGRNIEKNSPKLYPRYKNMVIQKLKKRLNGLKKSTSVENEKKYKEISEILEAVTKNEVIENY